MYSFVHPLCHQVSLSQLSSFEDSLEQFQRWVQEAAAKLKMDADLRPSLHDKKLQLQTHKVKVEMCNGESCYNGL